MKKVVAKHFAAIGQREVQIFVKHASLSTVPFGAVFTLLHIVGRCDLHEAILTAVTLASASAWEGVSRDLERVREVACNLEDEVERDIRHLFGHDEEP